MTKTAIRPAVPADRDTLEALIAECYETVYPGWYDSELLIEALPQMLRIDPALLASGRYFVATADGKTAGCGGWSVKAPGAAAQAGTTGHIRHFATHPDFMRSGIGGAILDRCIAEAEAAKVSALMCFSSVPAEAFYARHGFQRKDSVSIMLAEGTAFPAILMERRL